MKVLNKDELHVAEGILLKHIPKSFKVYGFLFGINRNKPSTVEMVVDSWPDFKVIICRPDPTNRRALNFVKKVTFFSTDENVLGKMLREEIDWSTYFMIGGFDISHAPVLRAISSEKKVNNQCYTLVRLLYLPDITNLLAPDVDSKFETRISSLNLSHVDMVNKTWKFGGDEQGRRNIEKLIGSYPSCCLLGPQDEPLAWILTYDYCAMGILYTLPEHRGKGYAKVLISSMAKRLHAHGFPIYCFIEEDNMASYRLFTNMGFTEDPSYRAAWFQFNA